MFVDHSLLDAAIKGVILASVALIWVVFFIRLNGLRSLSKMTNFDFVMTVALGSLVANASQANEWPAFLQSLAGIAGLFLVQNITSRLRRVSNTIENTLQNQPMVLMRDGVIDEDALAETRTAKSDLLAKLRTANALDPDKVKAVVLETTGDVSVMHGDEPVNDLLTEDVRNAKGKDGTS